MFPEVSDQVELLQLIFDNVPILIFVKNQEGKFVAANEVFAKSYGMTAKQIIQLTNQQVNDNEGQLRKFQEVDQEVLNTGETITIEEDVGLPSEDLRTYRTTKLPIKTGQGEKMILGISQDITSLKQLHGAVNLQKSFMDLVFAHSPLPMAIANEEGYLFKTNGIFQNLLGYTESELAERTIADVTEHSFRQKNLDYLEQLKAGYIPNFKIQKNFLHRDGRSICANVTVGLIPISAENNNKCTFAIVEPLGNNCPVCCKKK